MVTRLPASEQGRSEGRSESSGVSPELRTVQGRGGEAGTDYQDIVRARPTKREIGLGYLGVGIHLHIVADGGGRVVHTCPATSNDVWC